MDKVRMFHPEVAEEFDAPAPAVPHHRKAGWKPVAERGPSAAPAPSPVTKAETPKNTSGAARPTRDGSAD